MANRVFSVATVVFGASAVMSCLAITPAAAWIHHRHVRVYGYAPVHYVTIVRHPVYRYGYPVAVYNYYGYRPGAVAGGVVNAAGAMAVGIVAAAGLAGGILGSPYGFYPGYVYYPAW